MIVNSVIELVGNTPMLRLNLNEENNAEVFVKLEKYNPAGSVKDRAALGMIESLEERGILKEGATIVEPTSGNTGIALAMIGILKGYRVVIVMPETMSKERRDMMAAYGAELILTEGAKGMKGAIEKSEELVKEHGYVMPQQFTNKANPEKHYKTTAKEIISDVSDIDLFIASVGTAGTISGVGKYLKEYNSKVRVLAVEPKNSPVLSGGNPGSHKIQGIGAGFIPENYDKNVIDEVVQVSDEEAFETAKFMAKNQGILLGISSGAAIKVALDFAKVLGKGKKIVVIAPDGGEKYMSMNLFI